MSEKNRPCPAPFHQLFIQSSGKVYPCAFLQNHTEVGDVKTQSVQEVWRGDALKSFREDNIKGNCPQCAANQKTFNCTNSLKGFHLTNESTLLEQMKKEPILRRLDFMIDSACNLKCIMCTNVLEESYGFEEEDFWHHLKEEVLPHLHEIELIGGEPLLIKNTYKVIDLVCEVNPECQWMITTNGSYTLSQKMKDALVKINLRTFGYSIDSLKDDVFEKIRKGGNLKQVLKTLDDLLDFNKRLPPKSELPLELNFVVQQDNAYEVPSFLAFARSKGIKPYLIFLNYPLDYSLLKLTVEKQKEILTFYLEDFEKSQDPELFKIAMDMLKKLPKHSQVDILSRAGQLFLKAQKKDHSL